MTANRSLWRRVGPVGGCLTVLGLTVVWITAAARDSKAGPFSSWRDRHTWAPAPCATESGPPCEEFEGTWYWLRSPEEEKRVVSNLFNRYCIRCHGVDGRGVWDIPGVPDFTNVRWQASRSNADLVRIIVEGRGAVMPPFRGTLSLEEAWAMGRYLRSFVPGTEASRPDFGPSKKASSGRAGPMPQ